MKSKLFYAVVPMLMLAPALLHAQNRNQPDRNQQSNARIEAAMQAAARARIPVSLLESKVQEGEAKRVPQERVATAVEARLQALVRASETMRRSNVTAATAGDFAVTADALEAGVSENAVVRVQRDAAPERRAVAVAVLTDLVRLGHASETALARVSGALGSNAAMANLHANIASQLRAGGLTSTLDANGLVKLK